MSSWSPKSSFASTRNRVNDLLSGDAAKICQGCQGAEIDHQKVCALTARKVGVSALKQVLTPKKPVTRRKFSMTRLKIFDA